MGKTIAVDFDGVLHAYSKKWSDGSIYDEPVAMQAFLNKGHEVVIYSTRCTDRIVRGIENPNQIDEMADWLKVNGIPYTRIHSEAGKPFCALFIDDNAYRFEGNWTKCLDDIERMGF